MKENNLNCGNKRKVNDGNNSLQPKFEFKMKEPFSTQQQNQRYCQVPEFKNNEKKEVIHTFNTEAPLFSDRLQQNGHNNINLFQTERHQYNQQDYIKLFIPVIIENRENFSQQSFSNNSKFLPGDQIVNLYKIEKQVSISSY